VPVIDADRRLLLLAVAGAPIGVGSDPRPWLDVLSRYAELQRGEKDHVEDHLAAGVPDRGPTRLPSLYETMLEQDLPLDDDAARRLRAFRPRFDELCAELADAGVAETMQHDDLQGNSSFVAGAHSGSSTGATRASRIRS
jgi:hypothetical protein